MSAPVAGLPGYVGLTDAQPEAVLSMLSDVADRALGLNNRARTIRRFDMPGDFGRCCVLYVVPYRRWAYRRQELATADYWRERGQLRAVQYDP